MKNLDGRSKAIGPCDRDRHAVGREQQHRAARRIAPEPVAVVVHRAGRDDPAWLRARDCPSMSLPRHRRTVRIGVDRLAQPRAIDHDTSRIVLRENAEVERSELLFAHAAETG